MSKRKYTHIKMLYPGMGQSIEAARGALPCSHPAWKRVFFYAGVSQALMKACVKRGIGLSPAGVWIEIVSFLSPSKLVRVWYQEQSAACLICS